MCISKKNVSGISPVFGVIYELKEAYVGYEKIEKVDG
jgi:hypothetical protein